jgi:hypothetical protein
MRGKRASEWERGGREREGGQNDKTTKETFGIWSSKCNNKLKTLCIVAYKIVAVDSKPVHGA